MWQRRAFSSDLHSGPNKELDIGLNIKEAQMELK